jgi:ApaG protein
VSDHRTVIEPTGLRVTVDRVVHHVSDHLPPERPHCFIYFITIHNDTDRLITIVGRKWVVTDSRGERTVVEGEGVVGQKPAIEPGGSFSYNSYHLLDAGCAWAEAGGSYLGVDSDGRRVVTRIPLFRMVVP